MTSVSVVIPYFNQPEQLLRTWEGLVRQGIADLQVIVADDGSSSPPPRLGDDVVHVRQQDLGFRAGAARNLGAAAADGDVLAFLDADTVPEPGYLRALIPCTTGKVLTVGRRRHADLTGWTPEQTGRWLEGGPAPRELSEPSWLIDGYRETDDLERGDGRSFRFVISAVMALRTELFRRLRGFDERYVGYGGEDWDLAYRAWNTGSDLRHVPQAIAWHDGPEWAERPHASKDAESRRLAELIPEPSIRKGQRYGDIVDVLVDLPAGASVQSQGHQDFAVGDGSWSQDQLDRARFRVTLDHPVALGPSVLAEVVALLDWPRPPEVGLVDSCGTVLGTARATRGSWGRVDLRVACRAD